MNYLRNSQPRTHCREYLAVTVPHASWAFMVKFCMKDELFDNRDDDGGGSKVGTPIKVAMLSDCTFEEPYVVHSCEQPERSRFRLMWWCSTVKPVTQSIAEPSITLPQGPFSGPTDEVKLSHGVPVGSTLPDSPLSPRAAATRTTSNSSGKSSNKGLLSDSNVVIILLAKPFVILMPLP